MVVAAYVLASLWLLRGAYGLVAYGQAILPVNDLPLRFVILSFVYNALGLVTAAFLFVAARRMGGVRRDS